MGDREPVVRVQDAFCLHPIPDGAVVALRGLTLTVAAGERVVVHGPSGSGKTTLMRLLAGEQPMAAGEAVVAGTRVGGRQRVPAARLGWIDQNPTRTLRPELDVLGNILAQQRLSGASRAAAAGRAEPLMIRLGVADLAGRRPQTLSGGEAQRVAVCAALAHGPDLVLADEPAGELDAAGAAQVYDALAEGVAQVGAALVLVSHDELAARVADRVVRIRDGRLSETWAPAGPGGEVEEFLVVDHRGWVRLPGAGGLGAVRVVPGPAGVVTLRPVNSESAVAQPFSPMPLAPEPGSQPEPASASAPVARLTGAGRQYAGKWVLRGVDLTVHAGVLTVIRGRSGSGKSTALRLLLGLERPDEGAAEAGGVDLATLDRAALAEHRRTLTAYAGQEPQLVETLDVTANLDLARAMRGQGADPDATDRALAATDLVHLARRTSGRLSGGERQRVAVARALAVEARLVVCDEPTSQLDEATAGHVAQALLATARAGTAVVVATHDPVLLDLADVVLDLTG